MNVLIIEDENLSQDYLEDLLKKCNYDINIVDRVDSVKNSIKWFLQNPTPDLVFMDIDLGDGLCFEVFEVVSVDCPIIFTTAYDEYAIRAFKVNSIDYLLKPFAAEEINQALDKFSRLAPRSAKAKPDFLAAGRMLAKSYKERFIIKIGERLKTLAVQDIMFFMSRDKATFAGTAEGRNYLIDYSLDNLEEMLDPARYYRINRKYIIRDEAILDIIAYSNSRLQVNLKGTDERNIIVARDRVQSFKSWLDR